MKNFTACVFPDTLPDEELLFPLVPVFGELVYLQAVENEPLATELSTPFLDRLLQQGTLQLFTPAPLGGQRERFLALTGDMQKRGADYMSQLSMLTLAGMHRRGEEESKNAILASLLQSGNIDSRKEEEELLLWQSRLLLKLGECFDAEQAELHRALRKLAGREDALMAELREEDSPFSLMAGLQDSDDKAGGILNHRLKAWSRLYFHGTPPVPPQIFVTRHEAALDTLQEVFEKNHRHSARQIASLELPARCDLESLDASTSDPLIRHCPGLQAALALLTATEAAPPSLGEELAQRFTALTPDWSHCVDSRYPAGQYGRCTLELFLFPEISARQLFLESFAGGGVSEDDTRLTAGSSVMVGLLKKESPFNVP